MSYAAVIDIGSNEMRLNIAQSNENNGLKYIDTLSYPLSLGKDTFHTGKMDFDKADQACEIIKYFLHVCKGYGVKNIKTIASTAVREASNMSYILDQINIKTGVTVRVLDDLEEKKYIYKLLSHFTPDEKKQNTLMVYVGTGSVGICLIDNGKMPYNWNIKLGSLRIQEELSGIQDYTNNYHKLVEDYISGFFPSLMLQGKNIELITSGQEIGIIARIANKKPIDDSLFFDIPKNIFHAFFDKIKYKSPDRISIDFNLDDEQAAAILPAACLYKHLLGLTSANALTVSKLLPCDGVLFEMLYPKIFKNIQREFEKNTLLSARKQAQKFINSAHGEIVSEYATFIFDKIKKLHALDRREKLILKTAAILHDIGEYINVRDHSQYSYSIVKGLDIVGLNELEIEIVALLCRYHSDTIPRDIDSNIKVRLSKLAAMLRLADALDRSGEQKFKDFHVKLTDSALIITAKTNEQTALEEWAFKKKSNLFESVFGIKAILNCNKV